MKPAFRTVNRAGFAHFQLNASDYHARNQSVDHFDSREMTMKRRGRYRLLIQWALSGRFNDYPLLVS